MTSANDPRGFGGAVTTDTFEGTSHSSFARTIYAVSEGNPGAAVAYVNGYQEAVAAAMRAAGEQWDADVIASRLTGPDLHIAFKDECKSDPAAFVRLVQLLAASGGARQSDASKDVADLREIGAAMVARAQEDVREVLRHVQGPDGSVALTIGRTKGGAR